MDELYVVWTKLDDGWRPSCPLTRYQADVWSAQDITQGYDVRVHPAPRMTAQAFAEE